MMIIWLCCPFSAGQVLGPAQLTLSIQQQQQQHTAAVTTGQRGRQMFTGVPRPASAPNAMPAATVSSGVETSLFLPNFN